jgi:hypothetical protein
LPKLAVFQSVRRQRKVIDRGIAVDMMRDGFIVNAEPELSEIEKFGGLGPGA